MKTAIAAFSTAILLWAAAPARAQVPPARGKPELEFPPPKPEIHLRSEWLSARWGCEHLSPDELDDSDVDDDNQHVRVVVHHTDIAVSTTELAMDGGQALDAAKRDLCSMRNLHMSSGNSDGYPWSDIGYHYLIDWRGEIWQGRPVDKEGANVAGWNPGSIGVALFGDFMWQKPTPAQLLALRRWLAYLVYAYKISPTMILGHQEFDHTDCPGIYLERYHEDLEPYVAAKASPLRRIRMSLLPLWWRIEAQHGGVASSGREKR